jgi:hypothetical protein
MEVEYTLTPEDIVAFNRYHFMTSPHWRRSYWMGFFWGTLAAILLFIVLSGWKSWWNALFPLVFWLAYLILYPLSVRRNINSFGQRMKKEGDNQAIWGKHRLTISEQELFEATEVGETRLRWAGVERVVENAGYIFIYVSTTSAHVIPKKFFSDHTQSQAFYQTAKKYFDNARQVAV